MIRCLTIFILIIHVSCASIKDTSLVTEDGLHDLTFSDRRGWTVSYGTGKVWHTRSAGKRWKIIAHLDSIYFEKLWFSDSENGWLAGEKGTLLKTSDGGLSWQRVVVDSSSAPNLVFYAMFWETNRIGFLSAQSITSPPATFIYNTTDGGSTWNRTPSPGLFFNIKKDATGKWWATGTDKIFGSVNGLNWTTEYTDSSKNLGQLRGLSVSPYGIAAVGFKGSLMQKEEEKWVHKKITANRMRQVVQLDAETFFVAGDKTNTDQNALISKDGGNNWQEFPIKSDVHRMYESRHHLWLVGKQGLIMRIRKQHLRRAS